MGSKPLTSLIHALPTLILSRLKVPISPPSLHRAPSFITLLSSSATHPSMSISTTLLIWQQYTFSSSSLDTYKSFRITTPKLLVANYDYYEASLRDKLFCTFTQSTRYSWNSHIIHTRCTSRRFFAATARRPRQFTTNISCICVIACCARLVRSCLSLARSRAFNPIQNCLALLYKQDDISSRFSASDGASIRTIESRGEVSSIRIAQAQRSVD